MSVKLVVFDMAGTTVEDKNEVTKTFKAALASYGYDVPADIINPLMGYEKRSAIEQMLRLHEPDESKITAQLISNIHHEFVNQMIAYYEQATDLTALPHAEQVMQTLHEKGIKIGLNTGFSKAIAESIITKLKWREKGLFDFLVCSDEVEAGRPDPHMINRMMAEAGITDAREVAKVGDTEVDVREGHNAGCKYVIAVTTGAFTRAALQPYNPTHIIDDLDDVTAIVTQTADATA
ncbi:HAD-IA family hydrolase [Mucilaginibacter litoreus]|uniref:HAD-IA family hydrolase n=1 Tax=Mucilaginibacter litoreus TaxID=1048221 RepID=A0ABW3APY4_9SPHI